MIRAASRSNLSSILGQETIYLIMTIAVLTSLVLAMALTRYHLPEEEPPIITMAEAGGFSFATGSASVSPNFSDNLKKKIVPKIIDAGWRYKADILEVIGHTDEIPLRVINRQKTNLDYSLGPILLGQPTKDPIAADNVGLGMARAVTVARMLKVQGLKQFEIIPMSAGPFQKVDDSAASYGFASADAGRRRIEIRLRRRKK